ncbi:SusC/RagA family TonB-linked outer membrane protein [Ancylomarina sp. 16SWW S1-10-2]|uniref:SusC/RagA family TonB-linked outer membrane protein n=1 Tax=Ancylomarina sp. 16SWW S1-10-2 TaxID=2499681 RepID=UPI00189DB6ED|nr:SusC/RagA family TonB-linked outer membrane protein [Ancylomarina sp. 16SWW S1-10-2]
MKNFLILFLVFNLSLSASVISQTRVALNLKNASFKELIKEIEAKTELGFVYNLDEIKDVEPISLAVNDMSVEDILDSALVDSGLEYEIDRNVIIIKPKQFVPLQKKQQKKKELKGVVTDDEGNTLPGVTVFEKITKTGTSTDFEGKYRISVLEDSPTLIFSFIGMKTKEVNLGESSQYNVVLESDNSQIGEVVVTGIFNRHAESFTGSVVTVKSEELKRVSNSNVFESIKNLDPSLNIGTNLDLGSDPNRVPDIQLRGTSTFPAGDSGDLRSSFQDSPNQPLFILDGFEASATFIFDMEMERVSSITVLKDASAKAIYGSKAANGVVVIETKKPESGTMIVRYSGSVNIQAPDLSSYNLCDALEKLEVERIAGDYDHAQIGQKLIYENLYNQRLKKSLEGDDTDWLSKPTQVGVGTKHVLSVELGEKMTKIAANLSYNKVKGAMKGSDRENISGTVSVDYRHENLVFRNIMTVLSNNSTDSPYGSFSDYAKMNPYWDAYNEDGTVATGSDDPDDALYYSNPLYNATINTSLTDSYFQFKNNFQIDWTIKEGLRLKSRVGVTKLTSESNRFYPANHTKFDNYEDEDLLRKGSYQLNNGKKLNFSADMNLSYSKVFNEKHFVMANVGLDAGTKTSSEIVNYAEGFPSDRMNDITFALQYTEGKTPYGSESQVKELGLLGVFGYAYDNRLLADFTVRQNGSSLYGENNRWGTFYSVGLGWNVHKEAVLENATWLDLLKLRSSIGTSGSQNSSSYQSLSTYKYYLDRSYAGELGAYVIGLSNDDLKWQTKLDFNAGIDLRVKRVSLIFDYYQSITENLITSLSIPYSTGFSTVQENIGKVKNEGIEFSLRWQILKKKSSFLNFTFAGTTNKNTITDLSNAMKEFNETQDELAASGDYGKPVLRYVEGGSMNDIWAVPSLGIDPATGLEIYVKQDGTSTYIWDALDQVVCGNSLAKFRGNMGINGEFNGFGFSITSRFSTGADMYNSTLVNKVENIDTKYNVDRRVLDGRWTTPGQYAPYKILSRYYNENSVLVSNPKTKPTSRFVQRKNELNISAVSVYYNFKKELAQKLYMKDLRLTAYMNDIHTFSSIDVERGTSYPFSRTISFSLRATF